jgi:hypothetical protein
MSVTSVAGAASITQWNPSLIISQNSGTSSSGSTSGIAAVGAQPPDGGGLVAAIFQALQSIGVGTTTATTDAGSVTSSSASTSSTYRSHGFAIAHSEASLAISQQCNVSPRLLVRPSQIFTP